MSEGSSGESKQNIHSALQHGYEAISDGEAQAAAAHFGEAEELLGIAAVGTGSSILEGVLEAVADATEKGRSATGKLQIGKLELGEYMARIGIGAAGANTEGAVAQPQESTVRTYERMLEEEMDERIAARLEQIRRGEGLDEDPPYLPAVYDRIRRAADAGDTAKAEEYLLIIRHSGTLADMVEATFDIGTEKAFTMLREALAEERDKRLHKQLHMEDQDISSKRAHLDRLLEGIVPDGLQMVIAECFKRSLPADSWINDFSLDEEERKVRGWQYYIPPYPPHLRPPSDKPRAGMAEFASQFLRDTSIDPLVKRKALGRVIRYVRDANLQRQLAEEYLALVQSQPIDDASFNQLIWVGETVISSPACDAGLAGAYMQAVRAQVEEVLAGNEFGIQKYMGEWQAKVMYRQQGRSPDEVISHIRTYTDELLCMQGLYDGFVPVPRYLSYQPSISNARHAANNLLRELAVESAKKGNFADAGRFIRGMGEGTGDRRMAFDMALGYILTGEDAQHLMPDEFEGMVSPVAQGKIDLLQAMAANDLDAIAQQAIKACTVETLKARSYDNDALAVQAVERVMHADNAKGKDLARKLMGHIESPYYLSDNYFELARILIKAGDMSLIPKLYEYAFIRDKGETDEAYARRTALWYNWMKQTLRATP